MAGDLISFRECQLLSPYEAVPDLLVMQGQYFQVLRYCAVLAALFLVDAPTGTKDKNPTSRNLHN